MKSIGRGQEATELEEGTAGIKKSARPKMFAFAAADWLELKKGTLAPSSIGITKPVSLIYCRCSGRRSCAISTPTTFLVIRKNALAGAAPKTVNLEIGTLRAVLKRNGQWERILPDMKMLAVSEDVGIAISETEEAALLAACPKSRSRLLLPFVTLAIETGARYGVIRTLQWGAVDLEGRFLRWGKDKTVAGTGRVVPLNGRAADALKLWAASFPDRQPTDYVFPTERCAAEGDATLRP
jgi:integrase